MGSHIRQVFPKTHAIATAEFTTTTTLLSENRSQHYSATTKYFELQIKSILVFTWIKKELLGDIIEDISKKFENEVTELSHRNLYLNLFITLVNFVIAILLLW